MAQITERREVRVRGEEATFVFAAEPEEGRLVIREERSEDETEELCALTIADREELSGFLQGLRRVLGVDETREAATIDQRAGDGRPALGSQGPQAPAPAASPGEPAASRGPGRPDTAGAQAPDDEADRQAAIERARRRGQGNAFAAWTPDEEQRLLSAVAEGRDLDTLAREHGRSRRALELRLEKLRA